MWANQHGRRSAGIRTGTKTRKCRDLSARRCAYATNAPLSVGDHSARLACRVRAKQIRVRDQDQRHRLGVAGGTVSVAPNKHEPLALMAAKVLLYAGISSGAKAVGGALLDHVNWTTGRCDPSIGRLAKLTGLSRSAIQAGRQQLVAANLVSVQLHGGRSRTCQHDFNWDEIRRLDEIRLTAFKPKRQRPRIASANGPETGAQTRSINPNIEPEASTVSRARFDDRKRGTQFVSRVGPRPTLNRRDAAFASAEKRLQQDLHNRFADDVKAYGAIVEAITTELHEQATRAEMRSPRSGLPHLLEQLRRTVARS